MMDLQSNDDIDLEDGELSASNDEDIYTPLQRPAPATATPATSSTPAAMDAADSSVASPLATCHQIQSALDDESQSNSESSSGESSEEGCIKKLRTENPSTVGHKKRKRRIRRTVMVRVPPPTDAEPNRARFKKYNVWTAALQEEALSENMRGCDVTRSSSDRNVENYDFPLKYRVNGENTLKRRLSNSSEEEETRSHPAHKRGRPSTRPALDSCQREERQSVKQRIGQRSRSRRGHSSTSGGSSDNSGEPRHILDLQETAGRDPSDVAREMANKLYEDKDELLVRVVKVLGIDVPLELYKETQRIEADGGMMIKNGRRRRTPGGVFLFLLKHHDKITPAHQKLIFADDRQNENKSRKQIETLIRDRKVEELKKCLSEKSTELPSLNARKEHYLQGAESIAQIQPGNLSNPPPSPVGQEQSSPEYKTHEININLVDSADLPSTSKAALTAAGLKELVSYDDDILDVNYGKMDFF
ncbi:phosphorylated adapter RNA export protein [Drosophila grimshawi]|uniref:Phosphorylated adapter RNA export protein n=1 Tax=Drosophila grimshawi TaxID=7222 RepID=B4J9I2_DROGR|nr:phosphorylated adapter RNA export protein [Drosophila grimshawi]EDW02489.1 GH19855 [Drosophila grimshawi]